MFDSYIKQKDKKIREMFRITHQRSDSDKNKREKERMFESVVRKLRDVMEKRHYVSVYTVQLHKGFCVSTYNYTLLTDTTLG